MAKVHFFCEFNKLLVQPSQSSQEFGPVSTTVYNLTSRHTLNGTSKAFAMFEGEIRYQRDKSPNSSNTLNAILKIDQTKIINGLPLKYIIYRGINEQSLFDLGSSNPTYFINPINGSITDDNEHIVKKILGNELPSNTNQLALGLGIVESNPQADEIALSDSSDLDELFYNDYKYTSWHVTPGTILGEFNIDFGLDVIVEGFWRKPTMDVVRNIDVSASGSGNQIINPSNKGDKEQILQYMDIAALVGCFYREGIRTEQGLLGIKKKDNLYTDLLSKFINKNRVYLDIRNDNNLSLNYYDNYNDGIQLKDSNTLTNTVESYDTLGWPIYIFDSIYSTNQFINTLPNERKTKIELELPTGYIDANNKGNTLNICFLKHAPLYKEENFELFKRWPHYEKGEDRFVNLKETNSTTFHTDISKLVLSTYQTQSDEIVSFYFRLFYAKQKESQQTGSGIIKIEADNPLDNLFTLTELNKLIGLLSRTDINSVTKYRSIYDGNEKYIHAYSNDIDKKNTDILYSGMYKTGVAIDSANIYFFAIPYSLKEKIKLPKIKSPIGEYDGSKGFLNIVASKSKKVADISINKVEINLTPATNLFILNLVSTPAQKNTLETYDIDTIMCVCMERAEFQSQIDTVIDSSISNPFQKNLHPLQLQVIRQDYEPKGTDTKMKTHTYHVMELRVIGYKNSLTKVEPVVLNFYGFPNQGRLVSTSNAAIQVQAPILENSTQISIGHDPYISTIERNKYEEIIQALGLVKKYNRDLYGHVNELIVTERMEYIPYISEEGSDFRIDSKLESVQVNLLIEYSLVTEGYGGETKLSSKAINESSIVPNKYRSATTILEKNHGYPSGINKTDYEVYAKNPAIESPKEIAKKFIPKAFVNYPYYRKALPNMNQENLLDLDKTGLGAIHLGNDITSTYGITYQSPRIFIDPSERKQFGDTTPAIYYDSLSNEVFRVDGYSKNTIALSMFLAHELGHFVFGCKNNLLLMGWNLLEEEYTINSIDPSFTGHGHLEGNPSGNYAAESEMIFGQNFIEKYLWEKVEKQIRNNSEDIAYMKVEALRPSYLEAEEPPLPAKVGDLDWYRKHTLIIKPYLIGNLSEADHGKIIPQL